MCLTLRKSIKFTSRIRLFCKRREPKNRFFIFKIVYLQATLNFFYEKREFISRLHFGIELGSLQ